MEKKFGVWLDHDKAVIVSLIGEKFELSTIESNIGSLKQEWSAQSRSVYGPQGFSNERKKEDRYRDYLHKYYKKIIHAIDEADQIFILGPAEAKNEFKKEMKKSKERFDKIIAIERADKMTENQLIAKVKEFFSTGKESKKGTGK